MEVDNKEFQGKLLDLLGHISKADFIAFDLEMSGISLRAMTPDNRKKPTLQDAYVEMKNAANTFQVLQLGITCVEAVVDKEYYVARPYNFFVSPLCNEDSGLRLDRVFAFSSSSCNFLSGEGFNFVKVFSDGVTYLSREEEVALRHEYSQRAAKLAAQPDIEIGPHEMDILQFYRKAEQKIQDWIDEKEPKEDFINISQPSGEPLSPYQIRLVHQLVKQHPGYRAFFRKINGFMQVQKTNEDHEIWFQKKRSKQFDQAVAKQKGLSWIVQAISGGDLSGLEPEWFVERNSEQPQHQLPAIQLQLKTLQHDLASKKRILVGHNLFTDLGFLYKTFIGPLPERVEHFQMELHERFPFVIDTKYMATENTNSMVPVSRLKDLLEPYKKIHAPMILLHEKFTSYGPTVGKEHEAGYDSWQTAELFCKMTANLYAQTPAGQEALSSLIQSESAQEGEETSTEKNTKKGKGKKNRSSQSSQGQSPRDGGHTSRNTSSKGQANASTPSISRSSKPAPQLTSKPAIATSNRFAALDPEPTIPDEHPAEYHALQLNGTAAPCTSIDGRKVLQWLPVIQDSFWGGYVNKLRVNAAVGAVCDLGAGFAAAGETVQGSLLDQDNSEIGLEGLNLGLQTPESGAEADIEDADDDSEKAEDSEEEDEGEGDTVYFDADQGDGNGDEDNTADGDAEEDDSTGQLSQGLSHCSPF